MCERQDSEDKNNDFDTPYSRQQQQKKELINLMPIAMKGSPFSNW